MCAMYQTDTASAISKAQTVNEYEEIKQVDLANDGNDGMAWNATPSHMQ